MIVSSRSFINIGYGTFSAVIARRTFYRFNISAVAIVTGRAYFSTEFIRCRRITILCKEVLHIEAHVFSFGIVGILFAIMAWWARNRFTSAPGTVVAFGAR
jgi:hypothetical protein